MMNNKFSFHIRAEDHPNENLLQYFNHGVRFIHDALASDSGAVFVHCAMGKSRSATLVCAYLIWKNAASPAQALEQLCEGRPICEPNVGFAEQLEVWSNMCGVVVDNDGNADVERQKTYEQWEKHRFTGEVWEWEKRGTGKQQGREVAKL